MKQFIIKSCEYVEDIGEEYFVVTFPYDISKEDATKVFKNANKYVELVYVLACGDKVDVAEFDSHFNEMFAFVSETNGQQAFEHYLSLVGCKINRLRPDYEYTW